MIRNGGPALFDGYFVNKSLIVSESNFVCVVTLSLLYLV